MRKFITILRSGARWSALNFSAVNCHSPRPSPARPNTISRSGSSASGRNAPEVNVSRIGRCSGALRMPAGLRLPDPRIHVSVLWNRISSGVTVRNGLTGLFALVLASVGLAGMTAYSVAKRGHEIGIRMALGAQKGDVLALVTKEGATLVTVGTLAGLAFALPAIRAMSSLFFSVASVRGYDPVLLVGAPLLLAGIALVACYVPARRATRIDPMAALREE